MVNAQRLRWGAVRLVAGVLAMVVAGCVQPYAATTRATTLASVQPIPAGMARIWIYRDYDPYVSLARPYIRFNGNIAAISEPGGAFYRNVPPGAYHVTVDSLGRDRNQFTTVGVVAGQQVYLKVLVDNSWNSGGDRDAWAVDTFYVRQMLPQVAAAQVAQQPLYNGE